MINRALEKSVATTGLKGQRPGSRDGPRWNAAGNHGGGGAGGPGPHGCLRRGGESRVDAGRVFRRYRPGQTAPGGRCPGGCPGAKRHHPFDGRGPGRPPPGVLVELLLASGAAVNARTADGQTPLMYAAVNGSPDIVTSSLPGGPTSMSGTKTAKPRSPLPPARKTSRPKHCCSRPGPNDRPPASFLPHNLYILSNACSPRGLQGVGLA